MSSRGTKCCVHTESKFRGKPPGDRKQKAKEPFCRSNAECASKLGSQSGICRRHCTIIVRFAQTVCNLLIFRHLRNGGASRDRTDDLIVANSQLSARRCDTQEVHLIWRGSVYAALTHFHCLIVVSEQLSATCSDTGRHSLVTTQTTTHRARSPWALDWDREACSSASTRRDCSELSGRGVGPTAGAFLRPDQLTSNFFFIFPEATKYGTRRP
jgi:hypothetical protein